MILGKPTDTDLTKCRKCGSNNVILRPQMLVTMFQCLDCGYEEYL